MADRQGHCAGHGIDRILAQSVNPPASRQCDRAHLRGSDYARDAARLTLPPIVFPFSVCGCSPEIGGES